MANHDKELNQAGWAKKFEYEMRQVIEAQTAVERRTAELAAAKIAATAAVRTVNERELRLHSLASRAGLQSGAEIFLDSKLWRIDFDPADPQGGMASVHSFEPVSTKDVGELLYKAARQEPPREQVEHDEP